MRMMPAQAYGLIVELKSLNEKIIISLLTLEFFMHTLWELQGDGTCTTHRIASEHELDIACVKLFEFACRAFSKLEKAAWSMCPKFWP